MNTGELSDARKACESALAIQQKVTQAHPNLHEIFSDMGEALNNIAMLDIDARRFAEADRLLKQAVDCQKRALAVNAGNPTYRQYLANHLTNRMKVARAVGRDDEVAAARLELLELKASDPQFAAIEARLSAVTKGETPKNNGERLELAQRAYYTGRVATAAGLWADAFKADPKLAESRRTQHCYNAACAAALAGTGQSNDPTASDASTRAKLRQLAQDWLRSELTTWSNLLQAGPPEAKSTIGQNLLHWREDDDLSGVRDAKALEALPEADARHGVPCGLMSTPCWPRRKTRLSALGRNEFAGWRFAGRCSSGARVRRTGRRRYQRGG